MTTTLNYTNVRERWLESIVNGIENSIVVTDIDGKIKFINQNAEVILGRDKSAVVGRRLDSLVRLKDDSLNSAQPFLVQAVALTGHAISSEGPEYIQIQGGRMVFGNYRLAPLRDEDGKVEGILLTFSPARIPSSVHKSEVNESVSFWGMNEKKEPKQAIYVKANGKYIRVWIHELLWVEAMENYVQLQTEKERITVHATLKHILEMLADRGFIRIHRSIIVQAKMIESIEEKHVVVRGTSLSIGKSYRSSLLSTLALV